MFPKMTLVLGGANSGKSDFAESLVIGAGGAPVYIATAQAFDAEMAEKIARHKIARGSNWRTIEEPLDIARALATVRLDEVVLIDCLTLWLSNHLLLEGDLAENEDGLLAALASSAAPVVLVSNEVGQGIVPDNALSRRFRQAQGRLNRNVAARADLVVMLTAGLPMVLKGVLPGAAS